ncbi:MAG: hypothetical protein KBF93_21030 [Leptospiraceae bacterium]|nr:hypothetical protein [Leptospiraceae bacterium]
MKTFQFKEAQRYSECKIFEGYLQLENEERENALSELKPALENFISDKNDLVHDASRLGFCWYQNNLMPGNFVGLTWLKEKKLAIQVTPKFQDMDYLSMYLKCTENSTVAEHLGNVFFCWPEQEPIEVKEAQDFLWFIIGIFLQSTHKLCLRHLRKNFIRTDENLIGKTKGRVLFSSHIRENIVKARPDRIYSQFQIISDNCRENQILVAALEKCVQYIARNSNFNKGSYSKLWDWSRVIRASLSNVDLKPITNRDFLNIRYKGNYSSYKEPHQYAKMILNMLGADPTQELKEEESKKVKIHPFAICMYELFERYCEVLLRDKYSDLWAGYGLGEGNDLGDEAKARPDFLIKNRKYILDAKYKGHKTEYKFSDYKEDLKQMAWYSRHKYVLEELGMTGDKQDYPEKMFLLYPEISDIGNPPINLDFAINASESIPFLFKIKVPVPRKKNS